MIRYLPGTRPNQARQQFPDAMILRPTSDGGTIVFDYVGDARGHPTAQIMPPRAHA